MDYKRLLLIVTLFIFGKTIGLTQSNPLSNTMLLTIDKNGDAHWAIYGRRFYTEKTFRNDQLVNRKGYHYNNGIIGPLQTEYLYLNDSVYHVYQYSENGDTTGFTPYLFDSQHGVSWRKPYKRSSKIYYEYKRGKQVCFGERNYDYTIRDRRTTYKEKGFGKSPYGCSFRKVGAYIISDTLTGKIRTKRFYDSLGRQHGIQLNYYLTGILKDSLNYKNGIQLGVSKKFWPNGNLKSYELFDSIHEFTGPIALEVQEYDSFGHLLHTEKRYTDKKNVSIKEEKFYAWINGEQRETRHTITHGTELYDGLWVKPMRGYIRNGREDSIIYKRGNLHYEVRYTPRSYRKYTRIDNHNEREEFVEFYDSLHGTVASKEVIHNGKFIQKDAFYFNGQLRQTNNEKKKVYTFYYPNGNIERVLKKDKKTDKIVSTTGYYTNGKVAKIVSKKYGASGKLFPQNKPDTMIEYYKNGVINSKGVYFDEENKVGEWLYYHEKNGQLAKKEIYKNGKLVYLRGYDLKGNLTDYYEPIKDGRRRRLVTNPNYNWSWDTTETPDSFITLTRNQSGDTTNFFARSRITGEGIRINKSKIEVIKRFDGKPLSDQDSIIKYQSTSRTKHGHFISKALLDRCYSQHFYIDTVYNYSHVHRDGEESFRLTSKSSYHPITHKIQYYQTNTRDDYFPDTYKFFDEKGKDSATYSYNESGNIISYTVKHEDSNKRPWYRDEMILLNYEYGKGVWYGKIDRGNVRRGKWLYFSDTMDGTKIVEEMYSTASHYNELEYTLFYDKEGNVKTALSADYSSDILSNTEVGYPDRMIYKIIDDKGNYDFVRYDHNGEILQTINVRNGRIYYEYTHEDFELNEEMDMDQPEYMEEMQEYEGKGG